MKLRLVFLDSAQEDLKELRRYVIGSFGPQSWKNSYAKIKQSVELIQEHPQAGHVPDELMRLSLGSYRQVISGVNRIIYEVRAQTIYVHVICDSRMDLASLLTRRLLRNR